MPAFCDLAGRKFGHWTVLRRAENKGHLTAWHVRCDCGAEKVVAGNTLVEGTSSSCGCARAPNLSGRRYGRLIAKEKIKGPGRTRWFCLCDCGNTTTVEGKKLVNGNTKSCGCLKLEPQHNITHHHTRGGKHSPEYSTWANMLMRCRPGYKNHGDRGIAVCDRWRFGEGGKSGFECFLSDMSQKPSPKHEIDRWPDNDGNYEPDNCRWATRSEQQNNKRTNVFIEVDGRAQTKAQWEREFEWAEGKFYRRIRSIERVLDRTILPPIIDDDRDPQELTEASLRKAGFVRSTVSGEWIRRDVRRAYFKAMWDAMDGLLLRRLGMTAATLDVIRRDLEVAQ